MAHWQGFYTTAQVAHLTGIPLETLYRWKRQDVIRPSARVEDATTGAVIDEGYSYADLTIIRILRALRERQLDLRSAVIALRHLYARLGPPENGWADAQVFITNRRIFVVAPDGWPMTDATRLGQTVETRLMGDLLDELRDLGRGQSIVVAREYRAYVQIDPEVMLGRPVIRGTRVPTAMVASLMERYHNIDTVAKLYRPIKREAIVAAYRYEQSLNALAA